MIEEQIIEKIKLSNRNLRNSTVSRVENYAILILMVYILIVGMKKLY